MKNTQEISQAVSRSLERAGQGLSDAAAPTLKSLAGAAQQASDALSDTSKQLRDAQLKATKIGRSYVREKPLTSVAIGVGVGLVVGLLLRLRK